LTVENRNSAGKKLAKAFVLSQKVEENFFHNFLGYYIKFILDYLSLMSFII